MHLLFLKYASLELLQFYGVDVGNLHDLPVSLETLVELEFQWEVTLAALVPSQTQNLCPLM